MKYPYFPKQFKENTVYFHQQKVNGYNVNETEHVKAELKGEMFYKASTAEVDSLPYKMKLETVFVKHCAPNHMLASKDNTR